ncbi:MAG: hypothetical protein ACLTVW_23455 [Escherichia coli]
MKSMLHTVEQYGGTMQVDDTDSVSRCGSCCRRIRNPLPLNQGILA